MKLARKDNSGSLIISEPEVDYLLQANFAGFSSKAPIKKLNPYINQANLRYFVYQFYMKYSRSSHEAEKYALFLKNNFSQFDNTELEAIKKAFSRVPVRYPDYLI
jgi:hypothetical protein